MSEYTIVKDADVTITETITDQDITGATVTWMLLPQGTSFAGDLDALSSSAVVLKDNDGNGGVTLLTPASGIFTVALVPADTDTISPGTYYVLVRCTLSNGDVLPLQKYEVLLDA